MKTLNCTESTKRRAGYSRSPPNENTASIQPRAINAPQIAFTTSYLATNSSGGTHEKIENGGFLAEIRVQNCRKDTTPARGNQEKRMEI